MSAHTTLQRLASKLDLGDNEKVIRRAAEFERLLQSKSIAGSNLTDTAKLVICLDLAASFISVDMDVKAAIKYSGLKSQMYLNNRNTIENLLELKKESLTVSSLCLTLQCTESQALAEKILKDYQAKSKMEIDLNLPQYICMAVYNACRLNKVKMSKSKIIEKSRLKPAQWAKLEADWMKFLDENIVTDKKKKGCHTKDNIEEIAIEDHMEIDNEESKITSSEIETYIDWRRRMLETAYKESDELTQIENKDKATRRSPRKTPLKFSPYENSPKKEKGVRLLFQI